MIDSDNIFAPWISIALVVLEYFQDFNLREGMIREFHTESLESNLRITSEAR